MLEIINVNLSYFIEQYMTTQNEYSRYTKLHITLTNSIEQKTLINPYESHALENTLKDNPLVSRSANRCSVGVCTTQM
jgi:hypothetical protein